MLKLGKDNDSWKDDNSRNWMGGSVHSKTQKVQRVHRLECLYASFMLSLRYYLCLFYKKYASTKKQCYIVSCSSVYFLPPQRRGDNSSNRMGGLVHSKFQAHEFSGPPEILTGPNLPSYCSNCPPSLRR